MKLDQVKVTAGIRVGTWENGFNCLGYYTGPDLGHLSPGESMTQCLKEGDVTFTVGILFRNDLNKNQRRETVLILQEWVPEMFNYYDWEEEL